MRGVRSCSSCPRLIRVGFPCLPPKIGADHAFFLKPAARIRLVDSVISSQISRSMTTLSTVLVQIRQTHRVNGRPRCAFADAFLSVVGLTQDV